jgi:hypothetical protein
LTTTNGDELYTEEPSGENILYEYAAEDNSNE